MLRKTILSLILLLVLMPAGMIEKTGASQTSPLSCGVRLQAKTSHEIPDQNQRPPLDPRDSVLKADPQFDQSALAALTHLKGAYTLAADSRDFVIINLGYVQAGVTIRIEVTTAEGSMDLIAFLDWPNISPSGGTFVYDDDGGIGFDPLLIHTVRESGTFVLRIKDQRGNGGRLSVRVTYS